jgi:hypothetical protein
MYTPEALRCQETEQQVHGAHKSRSEAAKVPQTPPPLTALLTYRPEIVGHHVVRDFVAEHQSLYY